MIIFVSGVNDRSVVGASLNARGQLDIHLDGNCSVIHRLPMRDGVAFPFLIFGLGVKQYSADFETKPTLIFNQISDADTHRGALERCIQFCDQINTNVINHPRQIQLTTRDRVASALQNIPGVIMPRTVRVQPRSPEDTLAFAINQEIDFPYIVRVAGDHQGKSMVRLDKPGDLPRLHALPFDGRDFYLTEFIDYQDGDGFYHKQRIVVIDGKPLLRHSLYHDQWKVHANARAFMLERESRDDDLARFTRINRKILPKLRPAIDEITKRLNLEYYGIDCNLTADGKMLVFEANANMNNLHIGTHPVARSRVQALEKHLQKMLTKYSGERVI